MTLTHLRKIDDMWLRLLVHIAALQVMMSFLQRYLSAHLTM